MAKQYSIAEARNHLPAIVHDAEKGKPVQLTRRGKPVAVLLSIDAYERLSRTRPDFWSALQAFRERRDLAEVDVDEIFADVRDRSPGREVKW
jgi:prevent-host-death family protein